MAVGPKAARSSWSLRWLIAIGLMALVAFGGWAQSSTGIQVGLSIDPSQIVVKGTGDGDQTTVTLTLTAPPVQGKPIDLVLAIDDSASIDLGQVQQIAHAFVTHLSNKDQVAIVSFSDTAKLVQDFTSDPLAANAAIGQLTSGNQTALGDGLLTAIDTAKQASNDAVPIIVVLTDGISNVGSDPMTQAQAAASADLPLDFVGLSSLARRETLNNLAATSGGTFFAQFSDDVLIRIFKQASRGVAGRYLTLTQTIPGSLQVLGTPAPAAPRAPSVNPGRAVTQLQWQIALMMNGEVWKTQYFLSATQAGSVDLGISGQSVLTYTDPNGSEASVAFPAPPSLQVKQGPGAPIGGPNQPNQPSQPPSPGSPPPSPQSGSSSVTANVAADPAEALLGQAISFDASGSSSSGGDIKTYQWDWNNDGTYDSEGGPTILHSFAEAGQHTVVVQVTDANGNEAQASVQVTIDSGIEGGAGVSPDYQGTPTIPDWMSYYIDDNVVTDEEVRDANARFAADVFIPGTHYRLTADDVTAIVQLNQLGHLMSQYDSPDAAVKAGYVKFGDFVPHVGQAYVKPLSDPTTPVFNDPPVLLYGYDSDGNAVLAGVRFITTNQDASLFELTGWPSHAASAVYADGSVEAVSSAESAKPENSAGSALLFWNPTLYGLTVWTNIINSNGLFAGTNPSVNQPQ